MMKHKATFKQRRSQRTALALEASSRLKSFGFEVVVVVVGTAHSGSLPFQRWPSQPRTGSPTRRRGSSQANLATAPPKSCSTRPPSGTRTSSQPGINVMLTISEILTIFSPHFGVFLTTNVVVFFSAQMTLNFAQNRQFFL
jgi:hypothetical protein